MPKQDERKETFKSSFATGFDHKKMAGAKIGYAVNLDNEDHTGNKLIASLELMTAQNPQHITWFIACELGHLNIQIQNNGLLDNPEKARLEAKEKGDLLEKEHRPLLEEFKKENKVGYEILRWYQFDNLEKDNENTNVFRESLSQVYFIYLLGKLKLDYKVLHKIFDSICEEKNNKKAMEILQETISDKHNLNLASNILDRVVALLRDKKKFMIMEIFSNDITGEMDVCSFANDFSSKVNSVAESRKKNFANTVTKGKPFNEIVAWVNSRDYALLDTAMILTLAKTQKLDFLFYPLRQQKTYLQFLQTLRQLCKKYNLAIIDIIINSREPKHKFQKKYFRSSNSTATFFPEKIEFKAIPSNPKSDTYETTQEDYASLIKQLFYNNTEEMLEYAALIEQQYDILQKLKHNLASKAKKTKTLMQFLKDTNQPVPEKSIEIYKKIISEHLNPDFDEPHTVSIKDHRTLKTS